MVRFIEDTHKYEDIVPSEQPKWTSVTQLIHMYEPQKDWDLIAERYAKKHKIPVSEVKAKWRKENEISVERGVKFHKQREQDLLSCQTIDEKGTPLIIHSPCMDDYGNKVAPSQKLEDGIYPELLVLLKSARICGQADYVMICDGYVHIKDYKTNKAIKMNGFVSWDGVEEMMLHPVSGTPNSNYWHYALQLNIYAYIIRKNNPKLKLGKLELLHVQFDEEEEVSKIQPYILPDLQSQAQSIINDFKNRKR